VRGSRLRLRLRLTKCVRSEDSQHSVDEMKTIRRCEESFVVASEMEVARQGRKREVLILQGC
jgi:hypothetical protein